jgi:hypothetical protein
MNQLVDANDRIPTDYVHFGFIFAGIIVGLAGVVTQWISLGTLGVVLITLGLWYFLMDN